MFINCIVAKLCTGLVDQHHVHTGKTTLLDAKMHTCSARGAAPLALPELACLRSQCWQASFGKMPSSMTVTCTPIWAAAVQGWWAQLQCMH